MRAVSVRVNEVVSVAGFVGPGTRVDILLTGTPNGSSEPQTTTVLQNVAVIAAGQRLERNAAGDAQNTPVITLLASPEDAERLTLASRKARFNSPCAIRSIRIRIPWTRQRQGTLQGWHSARGAPHASSPSRQGAKDSTTAAHPLGPQR